MSKLKEDFGSVMSTVLYGKKIIIKDKGMKIRGRVTDISFSDGLLKVSLDNGLTVYELDGDSYIKLLK